MEIIKRLDKIEAFLSTKFGFRREEEEKREPQVNTFLPQKFEFGPIIEEPPQIKYFEDNFSKLGKPDFHQKMKNLPPPSIHFEFEDSKQNSSYIEANSFDLINKDICDKVHLNRSVVSIHQDSLQDIEIENLSQKAREDINHLNKIFDKPQDMTYENKNLKKPKPAGSYLQQFTTFDPQAEQKIEIVMTKFQRDEIQKNQPGVPKIDSDDSDTDPGIKVTQSSPKQKNRGRGRVTQKEVQRVTFKEYAKGKNIKNIKSLIDSYEDFSLHYHIVKINEASSAKISREQYCGISLAIKNLLTESDCIGCLNFKASKFSGILLLDKPAKDKLKAFSDELCGDLGAETSFTVHSAQEINYSLWQKADQYI